MLRKTSGLLKAIRMTPEVTKLGNPILRQPSEQVGRDQITTGETVRLIKQMVAAMRSDKGQGISAVQIGVPKRVSVFEITPEMVTKLPQEMATRVRMEVLPLLTLVDYTVTPRGDHTAVHREGCLSVPGLSAFVERAVNVHVTGYDGAGEKVDFDAYGWTARLLQHEHDHLNGVLYTDRMVPSTLAFTDELNSIDEFIWDPTAHAQRDRVRARAR